MRNKSTPSYKEGTKNPYPHPQLVLVYANIHALSTYLIQGTGIIYTVRRKTCLIKLLMGKVDNKWINTTRFSKSRAASWETRSLCPILGTCSGETAPKISGFKNQRSYLQDTQRAVGNYDNSLENWHADSPTLRPSADTEVWSTSRL